MYVFVYSMTWALCVCILYVNTLYTLHICRNTIVKSSVYVILFVSLFCSNKSSCCSSILLFLSIFYVIFLFCSFLLYFLFPAFYIVLFCLSMLATVPIQGIRSTETASSLTLSPILTIHKHVTLFSLLP